MKEVYRGLWLLCGTSLADWDPPVWEGAGRGSYGVVHETTSHTRQKLVQALGDIKIGEKDVQNRVW